MEQNQQGGSSQAFPAPLQNFQQLALQQRQQLHMFWNYQRQEMEQAADFKNHQLPLARIKKIMKADEDVRMISAEAPILFAKACELFVLELTIRSWLHAEENKRRTLQKNDIAAAITRTDIFDFLVDIVPREEAFKEEAGSGLVGPAQGVEGGVESAAAAAGVPYYYQPMGAGMFVGQPAGVGWWGEDGSGAQGPYHSSGNGQGMDGVPGYVAAGHPPLPPPAGS